MAFSQSPAPCWNDTNTITTTFDGTSGLNEAHVRLAPAPNRSVATVSGLWTNPAPHKRMTAFVPPSWSASPVAIPGTTPTQSVTLTIPANPFGLASIPAAPYNKYVMQVTATLPGVNVPVSGQRFYYEWTISQGVTLAGPLRIWAHYHTGGGGGVTYPGWTAAMAYGSLSLDMSQPTTISLAGFSVMPNTSISVPTYYYVYPNEQPSFGIIADLSHEG